MENKKYKIVVLSDLKSTTVSLIKNTVGLAKMINGDIELFHVKKPTEIVKRESQLSAVRDINEQSLNTHNQLKNLLEPIAKDYDIKLSYKYAIGNVKGEIESYIKESSPDVIVLGKRKPSAIRIVGDNLADFVLKKFEGPVLITSNDDLLASNKMLSMGILNDFGKSLNTSLTENLINNTKEPLKKFKIEGLAESEKASDLYQNRKIVEYVFNDGSRTIETISDYVSKSNINLLCLDRNYKGSLTKKAINKVNVSLLVT